MYKKASGNSDQRQAPTAASITERLKTLDSLRASGVITEAEYASKRAEILDTL